MVLNKFLSLTYLLVITNLFNVEAKISDEIAKRKDNLTPVDPREENIGEVLCIAECYEIEIAELNETVDEPFDGDVYSILPVCGSDGRTYVDRHHLYCATKCGRAIRIQYFGPCCDGDHIRSRHGRALNMI